MGTKHEELNLGDIMSDAYVYAVENSEYYDGNPVDVAVVPSGTVRDTYTKGNITVRMFTILFLWELEKTVWQDILLSMHI